jgi:LysR family glycine cleavage system transcriptional activator
MPPALSERGFDMANWRMWMEAAGVDDFDDSRTIVFGTSTDALQTAIDGDAVALADFSIVANDLSEGRLVVRPFQLGLTMAPEFAWFCVYPEQGQRCPHRRLPNMDHVWGFKNATLSTQWAMLCAARRAW